MNLDIKTEHGHDRGTETLFVTETRVSCRDFEDLIVEELKYSDDVRSRFTWLSAHRVVGPIAKLPHEIPHRPRLIPMDC